MTFAALCNSLASR